MKEESLEAMAEELAARRNDPRTPWVVRRALLEPGLTLRVYLALEEADSPVLSGRWPTEDAEAMAGAFCRAWELVFPGECMPSAEGLPEGLARLQEAVTGAFATVMPMRFAGQREESPAPPDGLGWVARVVGRFVGLGWRLEEVLDVPLGALFVLLAGMAAAEGATCAGQDYRERSAFSEPMDHDAKHGEGEESAPEDGKESEDRIHT